MKLYLKVKPNQRFNTVEQEGGEWVIRLAAPATDGKANQQLVKFMSEVLGISKSRINLLKGATSRLKCIDIDMEPEVMLQRLQAAIRD